MIFRIIYCADEAILPEPSPTIDKIESATAILSESTGCKVIGVGLHFIVKYGAQVDIIEGETMLLLRELKVYSDPACIRIIPKFERNCHVYCHGAH